MSRRALVVTATLLSACTLQRTQPGPGGSLKSSAVATPALVDEHTAHMNAADLNPAFRPGADMQDRPGLPPSGMNAEARLKSSPRHAEWVKIPWEQGSADSLMAWVVYPSAPNSRTKAPVVIVVHENTGLITWVRAVADQVAAEGFIAVAPDFLSRARGGPSTVELSRDSVGKILPQVNSTVRNSVIRAAANYAMMLPSAEQRYAVIGYCWGGQTVWMHAVNGGLKGFSGGVAFYGAPYSSGGRPATATEPAVPATVNADSLEKVHVPVMLLNGAKDVRISAAMPTVDSIMKAKKKPYTGVNYEGAVHGFLRAQDDPKATRDPVEEAANLAATRDAWPRTVAFLKKNLGVK